MPLTTYQNLPALSSGPTACTIMSILQRHLRADATLQAVWGQWYVTDSPTHCTDRPIIRETSRVRLQRPLRDRRVRWVLIPGREPHPESLPDKAHCLAFRGMTSSLFYSCSSLMESSSRCFSRCSRTWLGISASQQKMWASSLASLGPASLSSKSLPTSCGARHPITMGGGPSWSLASAHWPRSQSWCA